MRDEEEALRVVRSYLKAARAFKGGPRDAFGQGYKRALDHVNAAINAALAGKVYNAARDEWVARKEVENA
jgi:hypothetical protein